MLREAHLEQDLQRSEMLLGDFRRRRIFTRWQSRHFRPTQAQSLDWSAWRGGDDDRTRRVIDDDGEI